MGGPKGTRMSVQKRPTSAALDEVRIKIERAKSHVMYLNSEIVAIHNRNPYELVTQENSKTGKRVYSIKINECVPKSLSGIIGDTIHNLRAALDQLAWQLVLANRGDSREGAQGFLSGRIEKNS